MSKNKGIFGLILILLGVLLLLRELGYLFSFLLPFGLIAIGIFMIIRRRQRELALHTKAGESGASPYAASDSTPPDLKNTTGHDSPGVSDFSQSTRLSGSPDGIEGGWIKYDKFLGDTYVDLSGLSLEKIDVSSFLGDTEIKLIDGKLSKGLNRLVVSGFIGDIRIFLPRDTAYLVQCSNFIGDIEVGTKRTSGISNRVNTQSQDYDQAESKLFIAAKSFLGDIRIYIL